MSVWPPRTTRIQSEKCAVKVVAPRLQNYSDIMRDGTHEAKCEAMRQKYAAKPKGRGRPLKP